MLSWIKNVVDSFKSKKNHSSTCSSPHQIRRNKKGVKREYKELNILLGQEESPRKNNANATHLAPLTTPPPSSPTESSPPSRYSPETTTAAQQSHWLTKSSETPEVDHPSLFTETQSSSQWRQTPASSLAKPRTSLTLDSQDMLEMSQYKQKASDSSAQNASVSSGQRVNIPPGQSTSILAVEKPIVPARHKYISPAKQKDTAITSQTNSASVSHKVCVPARQNVRVPTVQNVDALPRKKDGVPVAQNDVLPEKKAGVPAAQIINVLAGRQGSVPAAQNYVLAGKKNSVPAAQIIDILAGRETSIPAAQKAAVLVSKDAEFRTGRQASVSAAQNAGALAEKKASVPAAQNVDVLAEKKASVSAAQNVNAMTEKANVSAAQNADVLAEKKASVPAAQNADVLEEKKASVSAAQNADVPEKKASVPAAQSVDTLVSKKVSAVAAQNAYVLTGKKASVPTEEKGGAPTTQNVDVPTGKKAAIPTVRNIDFPAAQNGDLASRNKGSIPDAQKVSVPAGQQANVPAAHKCNVSQEQHASVPAAQKENILGQNTFASTEQKAVVPPAKEASIPSPPKPSVPTAQKSSISAAQKTSIHGAQDVSVPAEQYVSVPAGLKTSVPSAQKAAVPTRKTHQKSASLSQLSQPTRAGQEVASSPQSEYLTCKVLAAGPSSAVLTAAGKKILAERSNLFVNEVRLSTSANVASSLKKYPNIGVIFTHAGQQHQVFGHTVEFVALVAWGGKKPPIANTIVKKQLTTKANKGVTVRQNGSNTQNTIIPSAKKASVLSGQKANIPLLQGTNIPAGQKASILTSQKGNVVSALAGRKTSVPSTQKAAVPTRKTHQKSASLSQLSHPTRAEQEVASGPQSEYLTCKVLAAGASSAVLTAVGKNISVKKSDLFVNEEQLSTSANVALSLKKFPNIGVMFTRARQQHQVLGHTVEFVALVAWGGKKPLTANTIVNQRLSRMKEAAATKVTSLAAAATVEAGCCIEEVHRKERRVTVTVRSKYLPEGCGTAQANLDDMYMNGTAMSLTQVKKVKDKVWYCLLRIEGEGQRLTVPLAWLGKKPATDTSSVSPGSQPRQSLSTGNLSDTPALSLTPSASRSSDKNGKLLTPSLLSSKVLVGEVTKVLQEGGCLRAKDGRHYVFTIENCYRCGVCLHREEPRKVLVVGMKVEFEVADSSDLVRRVWIGGRDAALSSLEPTLDSWRSDTGASSTTQQMKEAELLSPNLFPTISKVETTKIIDITA